MKKKIAVEDEMTNNYHIFPVHALVENYRCDQGFHQAARCPSGEGFDDYSTQYFWNRPVDIAQQGLK